MNSVRVCHISTVHPTYDTRIYQKECKSLVRAGFEVHLVVRGDSLVTSDGIRIHGLRIPTNRYDRMAHLTREAFASALAVDARLYHIHDPELLPVAKKLKSLGKKVIFDSHEYYGYQIRHKRYLPKLASHMVSSAYSAYESSVCKALDAVILPCGVKGKNPFDGFAECICFIDNYPIVDEGADKPSFERKTRECVCYTGTLSYERGVLHAMKASYAAGVTLILCGRIDNEFLSLLKEHKEYSCVDFRGEYTHGDLANVYSECFCGLAALLKRGQYWETENMSTKVYEYLVGGIPFIYHSSDYAQHFHEENPCCLLVDPEDTQAYASAISYLRQRSLEASRMAETGYLAVKSRYNWSAEAKKLVSLYEKILS